MTKHREGKDVPLLVPNNVTKMMAGTFKGVNKHVPEISAQLAADVNTMALKGSLTREDVKKIIVDLGYSLSYNEVIMRNENHGQSINDALHGEILSDLRFIGDLTDDENCKYVLRNRAENRDTVVSMHYGKTYNPLKDYFNGLKFREGDMAFDLLCDFVTDNDGNFKRFMRKFLLGCVHQVFHGHQNYTMILKGNQGIGKSHFCQWLCRGIGQEYFQEGTLDPRNKDHTLRLGNTFLWALDELGETMSRSSQNAIKAFLTQGAISERPPYGREVVRRPRMCSVIGTTNDETFLKDATGNRRYLVLDMEKFGRAYSKVISPDELWAEVMKWYRCGESPYLNKEDIKIQTKINKGVMVEDSLKDFIESKVTFTGMDKHTIGIQDLFKVAHQEFCAVSTKDRNKLNKDVRMIVKNMGSKEIFDANKKRYFSKIELTLREVKVEYDL